MANALGRTLEIGEQVVLTDGTVAVVRAQTFGAFPFTMGTKLGVTLPDGEAVTINALYDIDPERTHALKEG